MQTITIGGVPEHFNLPWHLAIEKGQFKKKGIELRWKEFYGGTGAMCTALREGSIDIAIILTEGIIKDIINGNQSKIVKVYVQSPLRWGIHVAANSKFTKVRELENARIAISRYGSGSQLMAKVNAHTQGFNMDTLRYEIVKDLHGGVAALTQGTADYFLWEYFTTKPYVDNGIFRRIDTVTTPWPCFVMAVRDDVLLTQKDAIATIIKVINEQLAPFKNPLENKDLVELFANRYQQKTEDVIAWLSITQWNTQKAISKKLINNIQNKLVQLNVIEHTVHPNQLIKKVF